MLCTSILSEVVLGFMLWSGWLGTMPTSDSPQSEGAPATLQGYAPSIPVVSGCPPTSVEYAVPIGYPQAAGWQVPMTCLPPPCPVQSGCVVLRFRGNSNGPLPTCEMVSTPGSPKSTMRCNCNLHGKMPCQCTIDLDSGFGQATSEGLMVAVTLHTDRLGAKEVYTGKQKVRFDTPTTMVLTGNHPEPVCVQVVAQPAAQPQPMPSSTAVWSAPAMLPPPIPVCLPMPAIPMPSIYPSPPARIPDPIPLYGAVMPSYNPPVAGFVPVSLSRPAETTVHRASVRLVYESGKARLSVKSERMTTECVRMKLEAGAAGAVRLAASKNHIHLVGTKWKAEADCVELGDDGRIVLTGHVKLMSDKLGVCAAVKAERLCVEVKAGKFERIVDPK